MLKCAYCGSDIDATDEDRVTTKDRGKVVEFCNPDCEAEYMTPNPDQYPVDYDEQDRNAHQSELIELWRNEY